MTWWYRVVRGYVKLGIHAYFNEIRVVGREHIPGSGPLMFTVNHQNAFLDALLVVTSNQCHTHFLARADVFKIGILRRFFSSLNMMPVYRLRDGLSTVVNNHEVFQKCTDMLDQNHALMLFPEANHHQKRQLLPLSKGFTRIALSARGDLNIIPVGINYSHHRRYGARVSIIYGQPISTRPYLNGSAKSKQLLRQQVQQQMQRLITHIPEGPNYQYLEDLLNQSPRQYLDPQRCNRWLKAGLDESQQPGEIEPAAKRESGPLANKGQNFLSEAARAISSILNFPPNLLCRWILNKIGDPVFTSSIKLLTGMFVFPIYYLVLWLAVYFGLGALQALLAVTLAVGSMWMRKLVMRRNDE